MYGRFLSAFALFPFFYSYFLFLPFIILGHPFLLFLPPLPSLISFLTSFYLALSSLFLSCIPSHNSSFRSLFHFFRPHAFPPSSPSFLSLSHASFPPFHYSQAFILSSCNHQIATSSKTHSFFIIHTRHPHIPLITHSSSLHSRENKKNGQSFSQPAHEVTSSSGHTSPSN